MATDASGWPLSDCESDFDGRPFPEWQCSSDPHSCVDDPWVQEQPINGTYFFNFTGKGTLSTAGSAAVINNQTFDAATWSTSGFFTLPPLAPALVMIVVTGTQRDAGSPAGSGFTNMRIMRPGHYADQVRSEPGTGHRGGRCCLRDPPPPSPHLPAARRASPRAPRTAPSRPSCFA